jgi:E3 ubiquitin-protein ligase UBR4
MEEDKGEVEEDNNDDNEEEDGSGEEDDDQNGNNDEEETDPHHNSNDQGGEEDEEEEEDEEMENSHDDDDEEDEENDNNADEEDDEANDDFEMEDNDYTQNLVETDGGDELERATRAPGLDGDGAKENRQARRGVRASHGGSGGGMNHEDDENEEEIDSDDDEDDDCEFDQEDEEEDDHDIVIHDEEDEDNVFRQRLLDLQDHEDYQPPPTSTNAPGVIESRKKIYLNACHQVLAAMYPPPGHNNKLSEHCLSFSAEKDLMHSILKIVHPPKKPANSKIIMRRAPTQEDFFRGSLSRNPISLQQIKKEEEPTVRDLRQHIATDLQMGDSAELIEILVANKILDVDLKLRVVHQVVWKQHLMQSQQGGSGVSSAGSALSQFLVSGRTRSLISSRSGLSMIFSGVGLGPPTDTSGNTITDDTPLAELPPMVITYRLTGVDGEATEDTVTTLEDPEAPSQSSDPKQLERQLEKEFGMTRQLTEGRGVYCLLKSVERSINDTLRRIRRDDVGNGENLTRNHFKTCAPYPGLTLLSCSAKLASNRELLLQSRAPTILLRLLLDVLHALEGEGLSERNPTAKELQELIEILASDMLISSMTIAEVREEAAEDASTLRLLLGAIETSSLSRPLRNVIAKLLPYLTYGQPVLCKELASEFQRHFDETLLRDGDRDSNDECVEDILMATFVHTSIALPDNDVCNSLRAELVECGYVERIANFVLEHFPPEPPGWSSCLWAKGESPATQNLLMCWQDYAKRTGLKTAFDMLIGLCKGHGPTQAAVGEVVDEHGHFLIEACHWLESTSDNTSARISMKPLGLAAETLLDELSLEGSPVAVQVKALRTKTRDRKKDIAMERRSKTLLGMGTFSSKKAASDAKRPVDLISAGHGMRGTAASLLAPVLGLFGNSESAPSTSPTSKRRKTSKAKDVAPPTKPAWMVEMEDMEDETGLTCAVCQEGKTLQPSELLGLYAYVKKISVPISQVGGRNHIDGTSLLTSLPSLPSSLSDSHAALEWYPAARAIAEDLKESSRAALSNMASNRRATYFTTTVSAGNAIHFSCHNRARQVDRNHPKAPKSEWEGATLRNSRVKCNVIMPLVTSRSSQVPLVAVDAALTEHQTAISNLLGARPKSMLWNVLHDVRLLLLRMAYGESLNTDCGGGSLLSNCQLVFHQLLMADMFEKDAQVDAPETAQHARHLSAGFLAASAITHSPDYSKRSQSLLHRGMADSSTMASLTCILFHNTRHDYHSGAAAASTVTSLDDNESPHPKRRWILGRDYFLRGLVNSAGRRHALGIDGSGCSTSATSSANLSSGSRRRRTAGFADWDIVDEADLLELAGIDADMGSSFSMGASSSRIRTASSNDGSRNTTVDDFKDALRPMIVYFAMMDQLSNDFVATIDDIKVEEFASHLVEVINGCNCCQTIRELLLKARVDLSDDEIMEELQKGVMAA